MTSLRGAEITLVCFCSRDRQHSEPNLVLSSPYLHVQDLFYHRRLFALCSSAMLFSPHKNQQQCPRSLHLRSIILPPTLSKKVTVQISPLFPRQMSLVLCITANILLHVEYLLSSHSLFKDKPRNPFGTTPQASCFSEYLLYLYLTMKPFMTSSFTLVTDTGW